MPIYPAEPRFRTYGGMDDADRNIMRSLAHEPCEWHCEGCGCCDWEWETVNKTYTIPHVIVENGDVYCENCATDAEVEQFGLIEA